MREIKFRVWHNGWNEMFYTEHNNIESKRELYPFEIVIGFSHFNVNDLSKLMQYTGLKDKNGKEIYEGDIVRYNNRACEIFCKGASFGFWSDKRGYGEFCTGSTGIEIIGNIHENPELIE